MKLIHYTPKARVLNYRRLYSQQIDHKPKGLWVSCEHDDKDRLDPREYEVPSMNWYDFASENIGLERLQHRHEVVLKNSANMLTLDTIADMLQFTKKYTDVPKRYHDEDNFLYDRGLWIDWRRVRAKYQGIMIPIYHWSLRLSDVTRWYYIWDCASGCIWDLEAIKSFTFITK